MGSIKVLYIEDEPFLGKIVKESLESRNFEIHMLQDGKDVLEKFREFNPDVCVLDVMLPYRDGFELAKEIRALDSAMPILFLTAKAQTEDVLKGFSVGGNDYIRKPFSMEELVVRINNLYEMAGNKTALQPTEAEGIALGRYRFFPSRYELHIDDNVKKLSHRETELLTILTANINFKVERREILMKVWGDDHLFNSRNLDVYITRLREYFRQDPDVKIITLKSVGYLFKCI